MRHLYVFVALLFGMAVSSQGCNCGKSSLKNEAGICAKDTKCAANDQYRKGQCLKARCDNSNIANPNKDCCPGQLCEFNGECVDEAQTCAKDDDCSGGQTCQPRPEVRADKNICSFPIPASNGTCADAGYVAFDKRCIRDLPCGGACPDAQVCNIETNACEILPDIPTTNSACSQSCASGSIKVYADPDSAVYHQCCAVTCACDVLPPLQVGQFGRDASAALARDEIVVASYNFTYGDLVVTHHSKADGSQTAIEFVDGVPATGTLAGDPKGYRNGIKDPGPNVGEFSSVVVGTDGHIRVTYYDIDHQDLKYAEKTDSGWVVHTVDGAGMVGKYSFLEIMNGGSRLRVSYLLESGPKAGQAAGDNTLYTGLRYIESDSQSPTSAAGWHQPVDIDVQPIKAIPCGGTCQAGEICVEVTGTQTCAATASDCTGVAPTNQVCAKPHGSNTSGYYVQDAIPSTIELPPAIGLFSSMVESGGYLFIAYYDNYTEKGSNPADPQIGQLRAIVLPTQATGDIQVPLTAAPITLDTGMVCGAGSFHDVGRFTSIAANAAGEIGIAYMDARAKALRYFSALSVNDFVNATPVGSCLPDPASINTRATIARISVADDGVDAASSEVNFVGANASLIFDASGKAQVAYQDSRANSLKLTTETAQGSLNFAPKVLDKVTGESLGWFSQLLSDGVHSWVMHARIGFDTHGNSDDRIIVAPLTLP